MEDDLKTNNANSLYDFYCHTLAKNQDPKGHEIYHFRRPYLGYHKYIITLSILCLGEENKMLKEIMHFHNITYMATPQHKKPCTGGHEIYNFG